MKLDPMARSGHLTDLGLEGLALGVLALPARLRVERHLRACATCRGRLAALDVEVPPLVSASTIRRSVFGLGLLAATVVAWVGWSPADPPPDFVVKGSADLEIWVHDGTMPALLVDEGPVAAGHRLGFRFALDASAYAMIVAIDDQGDWSVVFPPDDGLAAWIDGRDPQLLPVAVRLDDSDGGESFHGLACGHPFAVDDALDMIDGVAREDCIARSRRVAKERGP